MKIVIRADSSVNIGTGHLMRCITLADALCEKGAEFFFICRELPENICSHVEQKGYDVHRLPHEDNLNASTGDFTEYSNGLGVDWQTDATQTLEVLTGEQADWLIVDHYALDYRWEARMRPHVGRIMVIDDIADRKHDCDLLLDQNLYEDMYNRYDELVPEDCVKLLGPKYALLRREFAEARKHLKVHDGIVKRILIFFGGGDPTNETSKALESLKIINRPDILVDVVVGSANPHKEKIKELCSTLPNTSYHCQVDNMAALMVMADLALGAGGTATWERCALGLPSIVIAIADNQIAISQAVEKKEAALYLGTCHEINIENICKKLKGLLDLPEALIKMSKSAGKLADGRGAEFVSDKMVI